MDGRCVINVPLMNVLAQYSGMIARLLLFIGQAQKSHWRKSLHEETEAACVCLRLQAGAVPGTKRASCVTTDNPPDCPGPPHLPP